MKSPQPVPAHPLVSEASHLAYAYATAFAIIIKAIGTEFNSGLPMPNNAHFAALKAMELAAR